MRDALRSIPLRPWVTRAVMAVAAVAGLCVLADRGSRAISAGTGERVAAPAKTVADPTTTGSIRRAPAGAASAGADRLPRDELDRRGLHALVATGAVNAVAVPPAKRKADRSTPARAR